MLLACREASAVVYPASEVGTQCPVPTWNLRTFCQSVQTAGKLPEGLSAFEHEGATRLAMMGDLAQSKREAVKLKVLFSLLTRRPLLHRLA